MATTYILGPFRLDAEAEILFRGAEPVALGKRAVALLRVLVERPGIPVSKDALMEAAWAGLTVEESNLAVQISALRRVLGEEPGGDGWIETLPRRGYRFTGPISVKHEGTVVAASQVSNFAATAGAPSLTLPDQPSIAVLPFQNMSGDPEQDYFSDGISEDVITELSRFRELLVIARNSSYQFRGKAIDVNEVGRKLGVHFVVEGSVRKIGNRVRVTVQLIDTASAAHIWAERYDRDLVNIFEIQDEITRTVATQVAGRARSTIAIRARSRPTESLSAYDFFLQAREKFGSELSSLQGEPFLRRAIELDPNFADAHAMISALHTTKYFYDRQNQHLEEALAAGQRALDLDPAGPAAHYATGFALTYLRRLDEAGHHLSHAVALNPNEAYFRGDYALWMLFVGDTDGASREIDEALRRDPYANEWFWGVRGRIETITGKYTDALGSFHHVKTKLPSTHCFEAVCHVELGQFAEAQACLNAARTATPGVTPAHHFASHPYADAAVSERLMDALRRAEPPP